MSYPLQRRQLNTRPVNNSFENTGIAWNVMPGALPGQLPAQSIQRTDAIGAAVSQVFGVAADPVAQARHGVFYHVRARGTMLYNRLLSQPHHTTTMVTRQGTPLPPGETLLVKVSHFKSTMDKDMWNTWLSLRIREARMHKSLDARLAASKGCQYVPAFRFAGLDATTGLYYVVMSHPPSKVVPLLRLLSENTLHIRHYRAIEAAMLAIWGVGALLGDVSAGNILVSPKGEFATVIDFDSSIVIPTDLHERLATEISRLYGRADLKRTRCNIIQNSRTPNGLEIFNLVFTPPLNKSEVPDITRLQELVRIVYKRRNWFPDFHLLQFLWKRIKENPASVGPMKAPIINTPTQLARGLASVNRAYTKIHRAHRTILKKVQYAKSKMETVKKSRVGALRIRRVVPLPEEEKSKWRVRRHGASWGVDERPRSSNNTTANNNNTNTKFHNTLANTPVVNGNTSRNRENNTRTSLNARGNNNTNGNLTTASAPQLAMPQQLIAAMQPTTVLGSGVAGSLNAEPKNKNTQPQPELTNANYATFTQASSEKQQRLIDQEIKRIKASPKYPKFKDGLTGFDEDLNVMLGTGPFDQAMKKILPDFPAEYKTMIEKKRAYDKYGDQAVDALLKDYVTTVLKGNHRDPAVRIKKVSDLAVSNSNKYEPSTLGMMIGRQNNDEKRKTQYLKDLKAYEKNLQSRRNNKNKKNATPATPTPTTEQLQARANALQNIVRKAKANPGNATNEQLQAHLNKLKNLERNVKIARASNLLRKAKANR